VGSGYGSSDHYRADGQQFHVPDEPTAGSGQRKIGGECLELGHVLPQLSRTTMSLDSYQMLKSALLKWHFCYCDLAGSGRRELENT
jgi:hypothetical protein